MFEEFVNKNEVSFLSNDFVIGFTSSWFIRKFTTSVVSENSPSYSNKVPPFSSTTFEATLDTPLSLTPSLVLE